MFRLLLQSRLIKEIVWRGALYTTNATWLRINFPICSYLIAIVDGMRGRIFSQGCIFLNHRPEMGSTVAKLPHWPAPSIVRRAFQQEPQGQRTFPHEAGQQDVRE